METPLVSVVIPTYGRPESLKRCIDSVLSQTYSNIEVFIVDDNNPDTESRRATEAVMEDYRFEEKVTYLQHERNKNGSAARNTGWRHSRGKYITYIDDDDEIHPQKIEKQVSCMESHDESWGACYTGYVIHSEIDGDQVSTERRSGDCYLDALMRTMFMGSGSNLFLRKKVVDEINGYDETFQRNQDIEFMVRALEHYKLAYVDERLLTIYIDGNRGTKSFDQVDGYSKYYLSKFNDRINLLSPEDKERVIAVISLERCRIAFYKKEYKKGIEILRDNQVSVKYISRYFRYLFRRIVTHESYGFNGVN